jgi:hypothetical protein
MIEDKATEKLKKRLKDMGLIVNAGIGNKQPPTNTKKRASHGASQSKKGSKK